MGYGAKCVPLANRCDAVYHCHDHSDEENCWSEPQQRDKRLLYDPYTPRRHYYPSAFGS